MPTLSIRDAPAYPSCTVTRLWWCTEGAWRVPLGISVSIGAAQGTQPDHARGTLPAMVTSASIIAPVEMAVSVNTAERHRRAPISAMLSEP